MEASPGSVPTMCAVRRITAASISGRLVILVNGSATRGYYWKPALIRIGELANSRATWLLFSASSRYGYYSRMATTSIQDAASNKYMYMYVYVP